MVFRQSVEKQVCIGEVYALLHEQKYHRVTVIDIPRATRVKVRRAIVFTINLLIFHKNVYVFTDFIEKR